VRQCVFAAGSLGILVTVSMLEVKGVRRSAFVIWLIAIAIMIALPALGHNAKGATRWLEFGGYTLQPSEFAKPAFVVILAWLFAEASERSDMPALPMALVLWAVLVGLLVAQPDIGQTVLISTTAGLLYLLAGLPPIGAAILLLAGSCGMWLAYENFGHVQTRLEKFFSAAPFENFQVGRAMQSFSEGGFFGRGPGEGTVKRVIPDSHADFVFSVAGEEFGLIMCFFIMSIFAFIVLRGLNTALKEHDDFTRYAVGGLVTVFGLQAVINMCVNLQLVPAKGMTLPFISYGGSSQIAIAISMGMVLALTRKRPEKRKQMGFALPQRALPAE